MNRKHRLFLREWGKLILIGFILGCLAYLIGWIIITSGPRLKAHNKYQCAVYGYEEDCKTSLPPERRLK